LLLFFDPFWSFFFPFFPGCRLFQQSPDDVNPAGAFLLLLPLLQLVFLSFPFLRSPLFIAPAERLLFLFLRCSRNIDSFILDFVVVSFPSLPFEAFFFFFFSYALSPVRIERRL